MVVQSKESVLLFLKGNQSYIRNLGVKRLGLLGSFVRGQQNANSDVDILVEFEPDHRKFDNISKLAFFLEELFERRVELVTLESLSPYIGPRILKEVEYVNFGD
jgi:uncharacterized protein